MTALKVSSGGLIYLIGSYDELTQQLTMHIDYQGVFIPDLRAYSDVITLERDVA